MGTAKHLLRYLAARVDFSITNKPEGLWLTSYSSVVASHVGGRTASIYGVGIAIECELQLYQASVVEGLLSKIL